MKVTVSASMIAAACKRAGDTFQISAGKGYAAIPTYKSATAERSYYEEYVAASLKEAEDSDKL